MEGSDGAGSEVGVEVNTEEEDKLWRVLTGSLQDLPPLSSKIVRIFTSSTFTGTTHLTTHLSHNSSLTSTYLIIHLTTHLTTDLCCISLSVYLFFFFNTVHLSQLLCLLFYDCVSLTLLAYIFYLLVEPFFSTIFFRVFVSHKLLMVLYICLLIFRTSLMISLTVVKILVVYPRLMLGREGGTPVRLSSLTSLTLFITKSKPLRRECSHNLEESTRTTRGPVCFRPKYVCGR